MRSDGTPVTASQLQTNPSDPFISGGPSYNEGDNDITGTHVSDGDPTTAGILGARTPNPTSMTWRTFWTQQHGDNETWEITWSF